MGVREQVMIYYGERLEVEGERGEDGVVLPTNLLSLRRSPRQSTVPNGDRHLTTPIRLKARISSLPPPLPKVAQGTCSSSSPPLLTTNDCIALLRRTHG